MDSIKDILEEQINSIYKSDPNNARTALQLLHKLFINIIEHPEEKRFRSFKKTNEIIKTKVLPLEGVQDLLMTVGYVENEENPDELLTYDCESNENLVESVKIIQDILENNPLTSGEKVTIYQYDLTQGMAKTMGSMLLGKSIEGVWHTSVQAFNKEFFYGGGICVGQPKKTPYGIPVKELDFGYTNKTLEEFQAYLKEIDSKFNITTYNVLNNNCNHFTDAACFFLTGKHLPDSIIKQHEDILNTPMGQMFKPMLEQMAQQNNQFLPNMFEGNNNNNNNNQGGFGGFGNNFGGYNGHGGFGGYGGFGGHGGFGGYGGYGGHGY